MVSQLVVRHDCCGASRMEVRSRPCSSSSPRPNGQQLTCRQPVGAKSPPPMARLASAASRSSPRRRPFFEPEGENARGSLIRVACVSVSRTWRAGLYYVPGGMMIGWVCMSDYSWLRSNRVKGPRFVLKHCGCFGTCRRTFRRRGPYSVDCGTSASKARANTAFRDGPAARWR